VAKVQSGITYKNHINLLKTGEHLCAVQNKALKNNENIALAAKKHGAHGACVSAKSTYQQTAWKNW